MIHRSKKIIGATILTLCICLIFLLFIKNIHNQKIEKGQEISIQNEFPPETAGETKVEVLSENTQLVLEKIPNSTQVIIRGLNANNQLGNSTETKKIITSTELRAPKFKDIAVGNNHSVGLTENGEIYTWGHDDAGQLGREIESVSKNDGVPQKVNFPQKVKEMDAVYDHTIILAEDGTVWGFGSNFTGQLGDGTNENSAKPVKAKNLSGIIKIATGDKFTLALNNSGEVFAWGGACAPSSERILKQFQQGPLNLSGGYYDQFIDPNRGYNQNQDCLNEDAVGIKSKVPKKIEGIPKMKDISAGYGHALLLTIDGKVWSFGCNLYGQLGQGKFGNFLENLKDDPTGNPNNSIPREITNLENVISISAGYRHSIALDKDGKIYAWGFQTRSEKQGANIFNSANPLIVYSEAKFKNIYSGYDYTLFLDTNGISYAYGVNTEKLISPKDTKYVFEPTKLFDDKINKIAGGKIHIIGLKK